MRKKVCLHTIQKGTKTVFVNSHGMQIIRRFNILWKRRKNGFWWGIIVLLVLFVAALLSVRSEKLTWDMLPDYQGEEMDAYVYLTEEDNVVSVSWTVCYGDRNVYPVLFNEDEFDEKVSQIVNDTDDVELSNKGFDEFITEKYWNAKTTHAEYYSGNEEQFKELQNFLLDFDYQFALVNEETGKYTYKLKNKLNLKVLNPYQDTEE